MSHYYRMKESSQSKSTNILHRVLLYLQKSQNNSHSQSTTDDPRAVDRKPARSAEVIQIRRMK